MKDCSTGAHFPALFVSFGGICGQIATDSVMGAAGRLCGACPMGARAGRCGGACRPGAIESAPLSCDAVGTYRARRMHFSPLRYIRVTPYVPPWSSKMAELVSPPLWLHDEVHLLPVRFLCLAPGNVRLNLLNLHSNSVGYCLEQETPVFFETRCTEKRAHGGWA